MTHYVLIIRLCWGSSDNKKTDKRNEKSLELLSHPGDWELQVWQRICLYFKLLGYLCPEKLSKNCGRYFCAPCRGYSLFVNDFGFQEAVCKFFNTLGELEEEILLALQIVIQGSLFHLEKRKILWIFPLTPFPLHSLWSHSFIKIRNKSLGI